MSTNYSCVLLSPSDLGSTISLRQRSFGIPISRSRGIDFDSCECYGIFDASLLIGMLRIIPKEFSFGDINLTVGGIAGVSTLPEYQGRGVMRTLLNFSIERMKEQGIALSMLWGDTQRYRHFDWEYAGRMLNFQLNRRSVAYHEIGKGFAIAPFEQDLHLEKIMKLHNAENMKVKRSRKEFEIYLNQPSNMCWFLTEGEKSAYLILEGDCIIEHCGDFSLICQGIKYLLNNYENSSLSLQKKAIQCPEMRELYKMSYRWRENCLGMIKVINLKKLLQAFNLPISENPDEGITLKMLDSNQQITIITKSKTKGILELSDIEICRLLFNGTIFLEKNEITEALQEFFPLEFYWQRLDGV